MFSLMFSPSHSGFIQPENIPYIGFPGGTSGKEPANTGDIGWILTQVRIYSCGQLPLPLKAMLAL